MAPARGSTASTSDDAEGGYRAGADCRCCGCGYGAATTVPPPRCPMCACRSWARRGSRSQLTLRRLGDSTLLITPPTTLTAAASLLLSETVAELAREQTEIAVDLTAARIPAQPLAQLLLRLGALTHGSGGRLLAICPSKDTDSVELHELDRNDSRSVGRLNGLLAHALRSLIAPVDGSDGSPSPGADAHGSPDEHPARDQL